MPLKLIKIQAVRLVLRACFRFFFTNQATLQQFDAYGAVDLALPPTEYSSWKKLKEAGFLGIARTHDDLLRTVHGTESLDLAALFGRTLQGRQAPSTDVAPRDADPSVAGHAL